MAEVQEGNNTMEPVLRCVCLETRETQLLSGRMDVPPVLNSGRDEQIANV